MDEATRDAAPGLRGRIAAAIRSSGPVPFSRFMDLALNDPDGGYYAAGPERLGRRGDFFTASDVGTVLGECLARQVAEMDAALGRPPSFAVIEFGAGRGLLARDLLDAAAPELRSRLRPVLVDTSAAMRAAAARVVPEARVVEPGGVGAGHVGCALAVELFDALPVHRLRRRGGALREVFVGLDDDGALIEVEREPVAEAAAMAARYGAAAREGDEAEVSPAALRMLDAMATVLERGFLVVVDYGHLARDLYAPARRRGSLLAYRRHRAGEGYLDAPGSQDLTAHVNFTALIDRAGHIGLSVLGFTTQDRFLIANGALERFEETDPARWGDPSRTRRRLQALQLIHPLGMGRTFKVLVLAKGLESPPRLRGLADPFAASRAERP